MHKPNLTGKRKSLAVRTSKPNTKHTKLTKSTTEDFQF